LVLARTTLTPAPGENRVGFGGLPRPPVNGWGAGEDPVFACDLKNWVKIKLHNRDKICYASGGFNNPGP